MTWCRGDLVPKPEVYQFRLMFAYELGTSHTFRQPLSSRVPRSTAP